MQSKISCFNQTLFRKNLTRFWPLWVVASFLAALAPLAVLLERSLAQLQDNMVKLQVVFPEGVTEVPEDLPVLHASRIGRIHTLIMRMGAEEASNLLMKYSPLLVDAVPLTLEEIFIYELGGTDYAVKDIVL